jgi:hypothetical protein
MDRRELINSLINALFNALIHGTITTPMPFFIFSGAGIVIKGTELQHQVPESVQLFYIVFHFFYSVFLHIFICICI